MSVRVHFGFLCLFGLLACGHKSSQHEDATTTSTNISDDVADLGRFLDEIHCPDDPKCRDVTVTFDKNQFDRRRFGKPTILILDSGHSFLATMKYRNRIKDVYQLNAQGKLVSATPKVVMPAYVDEFFNKLAAKPLNVGASWAPLAEKLSAPMAKLSDRYSAAHGDGPTQYIAENVPDAALVLADDIWSQKNNIDAFCQKDFVKLNQKQQELAQDLRDTVIRGNGVTFINYSGGHTEQVIRDMYQEQCQGSLGDQDIKKFLEIERVVYNILFTTPGVLAIQAGGSGEKSSLDCDAAAFPHRIRAGYFNALRSGLNAKGELVERDNDFQESVSTNQRDQESCIDVSMNFGFKTRRPFPYNATPLLEYDVFSLASMPGTSGATSWAAPLATAWVAAIHKRMGSPDLSDNVIATIKNTMTPAGCRDLNPEGICKYQDPLLHKQLLTSPNTSLRQN